MPNDSLAAVTEKDHQSARAIVTKLVAHRHPCPAFRGNSCNCGLSARTDDATVALMDLLATARAEGIAAERERWEQQGHSIAGREGRD